MRPEVYAKAMHLLQESGKSAEDVVSGVVKSLKARGAMGLLPKILSSYTKLVQSAESKGSVLTVATKADEATALKESEAQAGTVVKVDENIIGGYRLEDDGKLVDNSFKTYLLEIYRRATTA